MNNLMVIDGIEVRRDAYGRYSLNDLHRAAVASGANARTKEPGKVLWISISLHSGSAMSKLSI